MIIPILLGKFQAGNAEYIAFPSLPMLKSE